MPRRVPKRYERGREAKKGKTIETGKTAVDDVHLSRKTRKKTERLEGCGMQLKRLHDTK